MAAANLCCFCCTIDTADVSAGTWCVWSSSGWLFVDGPDSCWSREWHGLASQPGGLYCEMCYLKWGLYVKPGQQYELSPSCEALALSVGVKFLKKQKHKSNPFLCICGRVLIQEIWKHTCARFMPTSMFNIATKKNNMQMKSRPTF